MFAAAKQKFTAAVVAPLCNRSITAAELPRRFFSVLAEEKRCMKDHNRRLMAKKYEVKRNLYKAMCRTPDLPADFKEKQRYKLSKLPRNSAFSRIRNRCILTGRPRAVYQLFRMSRICFRELANKGELMGIKKASW